MKVVAHVFNFWVKEKLLHHIYGNPTQALKKSIASSVKSCPYETLPSFTNTELMIMENALLKESNHNDADHCIGHKEGGCEEFVGTVLARSSVLTIPRRSALCNISLNLFIVFVYCLSLAMLVTHSLTDSLTK